MVNYNHEGMKEMKQQPANPTTPKIHYLQLISLIFMKTPSCSSYLHGKQKP